MHDKHNKTTVNPSAADSVPQVPGSGHFLTKEVLTPFVWGVKPTPAARRTLVSPDTLSPSELERLQFRHDKLACEPGCIMCRALSQERGICEALIAWERINTCFPIAKEKFRGAYPEYEHYWDFTPDVIASELCDNMELHGIDVTDVGVALTPESTDCVTVDANVEELVSSIYSANAADIDRMTQQCRLDGRGFNDGWKLFFHDAVVEVVDRACMHARVMSLAMICEVAEVTGISDTTVTVDDLGNDARFIQRGKGGRQTTYDWVRAFKLAQGNFSGGKNARIFFGATQRADAAFEEARLSRQLERNDRDELEVRLARLTRDCRTAYEQWRDVHERDAAPTPAFNMAARRGSKMLIATNLQAAEHAHEVHDFEAWTRQTDLASIASMFPSVPGHTGDFGDTLVGQDGGGGYCWSLFFNEEYVVYLRQNFAAVVSVKTVLGEYDRVPAFNHGRRKFFLYFNGDGILHASIDPGPGCVKGEAKLPNEWVDYVRRGRISFGGITNAKIE